MKGSDDMTCPHSRSEIDIAALWDGKCPLCQEARIVRLEAVLRNISIDDATGKYGRWARDVLAEQTPATGATT